jgi:hypothetical protein
VSPTNTKTMAALVVVVALIAGAVLGIVGDRAWLWHMHRLLPGPRAERFVAGRIVDHLDRELHFTPPQKSAVQQILDRHRARIDAISAAVRPQMRQEIDATNAEIEKVLTPEQRTKFRDMHMRMMQRHNGRRGTRGMGPGTLPPHD